MSDPDESEALSGDTPELPDDPADPSSGAGGSTVLRTAVEALRATLATSPPPDGEGPGGTSSPGEMPPSSE